MRYHNITKDDMLNGEGLRVVLWLSGCTHACKGCHNEVTWDINGGLLFDEAAKVELYESLSQSYISGITLSGGDPLHPQNRKEFGELVKEIHTKFPNKTIWVYTGYEYDDIKDLDFLSFVDVLIDGKFIEELKDDTVHWRGSSNQKIIDVRASLELDRIVLHNA